MRGIVRLLVLMGVTLGLVTAGASVTTVAASAAVLPGVTTIGAKPDAVTSNKTAALSFSTTQLGAGYQCRLVGPGATDSGWQACGTPASGPDVAPAAASKSYDALAAGLYSFSVKAVTSSTSPATESNVATASWTVVDTPVTTITSRPADRTGAPSPTWTFSSDQKLVTFSCSFTPKGAAASFKACGTTTDGTGSFTGKPSAAGPHVFAVRATAVPGLDGDAAQDDVTILCSIRTTVCALTAANGYSVPAGARFNNPLSTSANQRKIVDHVTLTVRAMPGFVVSDPSYCSDDPADFPSTIRVSLYSVTNGSFANSMVAAHKRCVSTQLLLNNHQDPAQTPAIQILQDGLGDTVRAAGTKGSRSFASLCGVWGSGGGGCRGWGVLHSKFYLFDTGTKAPTSTTTVSDTVMMGSSNMTGNATKVQWNNLLTVRSNPTLHAQYLQMFDLMKRNLHNDATYDFRTGPYLTQFWPRGATDPEAAALSSIRCTGVASGYGYRGRTIVYINMHAWFGTRGYALAKQVRGLYDRGCYVRVLYSFMSYSVFKKLRSGTGSRMAVRRSLFSTDGDKYADVYSHFKMIAASGNVGGNRAAKVTWTGSMNFTNSGVSFDEVMMRVASGSVYNAFRNQWDYINKRKSSGTYATFLEPIGGGRPTPAEADARRMVQPTPPPPSVLPPVANEDGLPVD